MTSYLNAYRNFIDISTKDGQALLSNATDKFESPFIGEKRSVFDLEEKTNRN